MYTIFDCETNGLPKKWKAPMSDLDNWPRVIQLAWFVADENGNEITRGNHLIKPDGWIMPTDEFWIENGFSQEESLAKGIPIEEALFLFTEDLKQSKYLISHNMAFDQNVVGAEMMRIGMKAKKQIKICTLQESTDFCKLPGKYGKYKWPKLIELYTKLFNKGFDNAHDALADVIACKDCFFKLKEKGIIRLES